MTRRLSKTVFTGTTASAGCTKARSKLPGCTLDLDSGPNGVSWLAAPEASVHWRMAVVHRHHFTRHLNFQSNRMLSLLQTLSLCHPVIENNVWAVEQGTTCGQRL